MQVEEAYSVCRKIARKEAKNFYYSFIALPQAKRNAICAVYAFMRYADDLSDDESLPLQQRRFQLDGWVEDWRRSAAGGLTEDPVFVALRDAQERFAIPSSLLEHLVEGTTMDITGADGRREDSSNVRGATASYDTYESFAELYRYCYLVASVVGLVCIRIFGYEDKKAEHLAEETGIAFQLTNILRDVREDAERRRIYLPCEDMRRFGVGVEQLSVAYDGVRLPAGLRDLLAFEARRAEQYYEAGKQLLPLIAADSRPALWVLIAIYHRLLRKIEAAEYQVFSSRVRVPTYEKMAILGWGILQVLGNRIFGRVG